MHILYEVDGAFKAGFILADNDSSLQVESSSGKRSKIKSAHVLLRYNEPSPLELLGKAEEIAKNIEVDFLWEYSGDNEFAFTDLADDYFGRRATAVEATALLLALYSAPVYFHRKGRGRFRKAPPEILAAALAGLEKKRLQAQAVERMIKELKKGVMPQEFNTQLVRQMLYKPDRNKPEYKALEAACADSGLSVPRLLMNCGLLASEYDYHYQKFVFEYFAQGAVFPSVVQEMLPTDLPLARIRAFSIDDSSATEIDDAFSVQEWQCGWRIGVHIATPGLGIAHDSPIGLAARERLSTVYMPGNKITMFPEMVLDHFSLKAGKTRPVVSLYLIVSSNFEILGHESCLESIHIAANLCLHELMQLFTEEALGGESMDFPLSKELKILWQFAKACEKRRGKPSAAHGLYDYNFTVKGDLSSPNDCKVFISARHRGNPLDVLISEMMIAVNSTWGGLLAQKGVAGIYRNQVGGKVRMTTSPLPHEGLGVAQYIWATAPLRRYTDLFNQWQLISCIRDETPAFGSKSDWLFSILRDFELTYAVYAEFQRRMERYWCLRWLKQESLGYINATVLRENICKLDDVPLIQKILSLPELTKGQRVHLMIESVDLITLGLGCRYISTLEQNAEKMAGFDEVEMEIVD